MTALKIKSALSSFFLLKGIIAAGLEQIKFEWNKTWHYFVGRGGYRFRKVGDKYKNLDRSFLHIYLDYRYSSTYLFKARN